MLLVFSIVLVIVIIAFLQEQITGKKSFIIHYATALTLLLEVLLILSRCTK